MNNRVLSSLMLAATLSLAAAACDGNNPFCSVRPGSAACFYGIAEDVSPSSLDGWEECWSGLYSESGDSISGILSDCDKPFLMLACRPVGDTNFTLAAYAAREDVTFDTGSDNNDITHEANGVSWYFSDDDLSWGFAPGGLRVNKDSCDYDGSEVSPGDDPVDCEVDCLPEPEKRLCWHTDVNQISGGYRCGHNDLNGDSEWERIILQAD